MFRIVDNKNVEMTDDEFGEFEKICRAHDQPTFKGEELFRDRFYTDDNGKIVCLKALGNRMVSFEVVFFLMNLMQNQHLRAMYAEIDVLVTKVEDKLLQVDEKLKDMSVYMDSHFPKT